MVVLENVAVSILAILLAICAFADIFVEKVKKKEPREKKTDWFFNNEKYDRKLDEKADKNQYRNY